MREYGRLLWLGMGLVLGLGMTALYMRPSQFALASSNDRAGDYIICAGAVGITPRAPTDGLWLLDYRKGKLQGTIIDRAIGKIIGWAEVDLVTEFGVQPRQDVHFMMTTVNVAQGQAALFVVEVNSGKIGVYTMGPALSGKLPFAIYRQDMSQFREGGPPVVGGVQNGVGMPINGANGEGAPPRTTNLMPFVGPAKSK
jgi:hypothetical protein